MTRPRVNGPILDGHLVLVFHPRRGRRLAAAEQTGALIAAALYAHPDVTAARVGHDHSVTVELVIPDGHAIDATGIRDKIHAALEVALVPPKVPA